MCVFCAFSSRSMCKCRFQLLLLIEFDQRIASSCSHATWRFMICTHVSTSQNESLSDYIHNRMNINLPSTYTVLSIQYYTHAHIFCNVNG